MSDAWTRQVQSDKPMHSCPCPLAATTLTPPTDRTHAFGNRVTMDREPAVLLRLSTLVSATLSGQPLPFARTLKTVRSPGPPLR